MSAPFIPLRIGVWCAAFQRDMLLLSKRSDLNVWSLPGGRLDSGERLQDAAAREVEEETGVVVEIGYPVALYYMAGWNRLNILFRGEVVGGKLRSKTSETRANIFFPRHAFPNVPLGQVLQDALADSPAPPRVITPERAELRRLRRRMALRYVWNAMRGRPEPRFPEFEVRASAVITHRDSGHILTVRGEKTSAGELREIPRVRVSGELPPWTQLADELEQRSGINTPLRFAGVWQDAPNNCIELVFSAEYASKRDLFRAGEWSSPRNTAFDDLDNLIVNLVKQHSSDRRIWTADHHDTVRAGDIIEG
ncbi:MAG: NUDIX domain-containing protein [Anaerolineae bacterium]|nr:NUDIX domain-containing protein [Anaerolineae bacterium]